MPSCAILECKNDSRKKTVAKGGITYHRFPRSPEVKSRWIDATGRRNWFPVKTSTICSAHFVEDDFIIKKSGNKYLTDTAVPTRTVMCFQADLSSTNTQTNANITIDTVSKCSRCDSSPEDTAEDRTLKGLVRWQEIKLKKHKLIIKRLRAQNRRLLKKVDILQNRNKDKPEPRTERLVLNNRSVYYMKEE